MKRREFLSLLGAATAWPLAARAQQAALPVVGFMDSGSRIANAHLVAAFWQGLNETGYVEGQNVAIEYRWAEGDYNRLPSLAAELVRRVVAVIVATGGEPSARAAQAATTTIPIVFDSSSSPVELDMVASLNRPGGNMTGVYQFATGLEAKRLGLLHELVPKVTTIAVLINPDYLGADIQLHDVEEAAPRLGVQLVIVRADKESDLTPAFAMLVQQNAGALLICASPFFNGLREQLALLAARHALPAISSWRDFAEVGGLISYGTSLNDAHRQMGIYVGRILKGAKPADLPVVQSTKFEFVINLRTAKALGLEVPGAFSARADEVIE
jgi:putative ABC transport system substrate-binding protein